MTGQIEVWVPVAALVSVVVTAVWTRSTKRLELVYVKKADAYRDFLEKASVTAHSSDANGQYPDYLRALHAARLVASRKVSHAMMDENNINHAIQMLRSGDQKDYSRREKIRSDVIQPAMERVILAMNADLRSQV